MSDAKKKQIAKFCKDVRAVNGKNRCAVVLLNMVAQDHSPLGLEDDHKNIRSAFHEQGLVLPESFVLPFKLHPRGAAKSSMKTYLDGRFAVLVGNRGDNEWLCASHLAGPGIELEEVAKIPPRSALHMLTAVHADKDISTSDRNSTTNTYQQRGCEHATLFLKTALKNMHHEYQASPPILIVDPCMHVGDMAVAAHTLRVRKPMQYASTLYYLGLARDGTTLDFCTAQVQEDMVEHWCSKDLLLPDLKPDDPAPPLPEEELKKIENASDALKPRAQVQFQVFDISSNGQVQWKAEVTKKWADSPPEYAEAFDAIMKDHADNWVDLLYKDDSTCEPENDDGPSVGDDSSASAAGPPAETVPI